MSTLRRPRLTDRGEQRITTIELGVLLLAAVGLLAYAVIEVLLIARVHANLSIHWLGIGVLDVGQCLPQPKGQPARPPFQFALGGWGGAVLTACAAAFAIGGWWGHLRSTRHEQDRVDAPLPSPAWQLQLGLAVLLAFVTIVLAFEAFAAAGGDHGRFWPITWYVRCANDVSPGATLIGAVIVSLLLGQWLAFRPSLRRAR